MAQVYGAGGKTQPKAGRLGTGSYWPAGTPIYSHKGSAFPGINVEQISHDQRTFGDLSRASISTQSGNRTIAPGIHPNSQFYNTITLPLAPAMVVSSAVDNNNLQPVPPAADTLVMPHERNTNSASGTKKKPVTFRTAFGASKSMPTDTAFVHNPAANYKHSIRQAPNPAHEAVKVNVPNRTFAKQDAKPSNSLKSKPRTPPPSFVSHGNHWMDPHMSFIEGRTTIAGHGASRWGTVKTGVIPTIPVQVRSGRG